MPQLYVKDAGVWKQVRRLYVRSGGVWKDVVNGSVKQGGVIKQFYPDTFTPITYSTPGTYTFNVPAGKTSLNITYPTTSGIVTTAVTVVPLSSYTVTIGNYGSGSSFGALLSAPAFTSAQVARWNASVDKNAFVTISTATSPSRSYSGSGDAGTLAAGASAAGLFYSLTVDSSVSNQGLSISSLNSALLINTFRAQLTLYSSRDVTYISVQPSQANSYRIQFINGDGSAGAGYYDIGVYLQQIVSLAIA